MTILQEKTYYLVGKRIFIGVTPSDYADWAVELLENGIESENVRILAGLDNGDTEEHEQYFTKALADLDFSIPDDKDKIAREYARQVAITVSNGHIAAMHGLSIMQAILRSTDYSSRFTEFYYLDEDIDFIKRTGHPLYNKDLRSDNIDSVIVEEFKLFLDYEPLNITIGEMAFCGTCKRTMVPNIKSTFKLLKFRKIDEYRCSCCGSTDVHYGTSQKGKRMIIDNLTNK